MRTLPRALGALDAVKRSAALAAGLALLAGCASGPSLTLSPQPKPDSDCAASGELDALGIRRVAVLPFASSTERRTETYSAPAAAHLPPKPIYRYLPDDGSSAAGAFENALSARRAFTLIERRDLERVLEEQRLQVSGLVDAREAVSIGKMAGADAILMGQVHQAYAGYENKTVGGDWIGTYIPHLDISLRLVHVETGRVAWTCRLSRNGLHYLEKPLTLEAHKTLRAPHAHDAALLGSTVEERIEGLLRAAARETAALLRRP